MREKLDVNDYECMLISCIDDGGIWPTPVIFIRNGKTEHAMFEIEGYDLIEHVRMNIRFGVDAFAFAIDTYNKDDGGPVYEFTYDSSAVVFIGDADGLKMGVLEYEYAGDGEYMHLPIDFSHQKLKRFQVIYNDLKNLWDKCTP